MTRAMGYVEERNALHCQARGCDGCPICQPPIPDYSKERCVRCGQECGEERSHSLNLGGREHSSLDGCLRVLVKRVNQLEAKAARERKKASHYDAGAKRGGGR